MEKAAWPWNSDTTSLSWIRKTNYFEVKLGIGDPESTVETGANR